MCEMCRMRPSSGQAGADPNPPHLGRSWVTLEHRDTGTPPVVAEEYNQYGERVGGEASSEWDSAMVSSRRNDGQHVPVIDLDHDLFRLIPSGTPGHFHLYINKVMSWEQFKAILDALLAADLIEQEWYAAVVVDQQALVRPTGHSKQQPPGADEGSDHYGARVAG